MQPPYNFKKYAILYVDDEPMALKYFEKTFGGEFRIVTAENANEGMRIIEQSGDDIGILLTDQRMPGEKGVQLLERARQLRPRIVRMIITAYADLGVTVDAVNLGNIFRYISKPLQVDDMRNTLRRGMEFFLVQHERDDLLREKLSVLQNVLITDRVISMGVLAAGLRTQFQRPLVAVESFLQMCSNANMANTAFQIDSLKPGFWKDFHVAVVGQAKRVAAMISDVTSTVTTGGKQGSMDLGDAVRAAVHAESKGLEDHGIHVVQPNEDTVPAQPAPRGACELLAMILRAESVLLEPESQLFVETAKTDGGLEISVLHDGPGIPGPDLRAVFDPRYHSKGRGMDWGLMILGAYLLASEFGAELRISARSSGKGMRSTIQFPTNPVEPLSDEADLGSFVERVLVNDALWARVLSVID